jgi:exopolysaccharide biosynthesis glucuronosyltransferase PssD
MSEKLPKKVMAIASGGGHWIQLMRIMSGLVNFRVVFVTVNLGYKADVGATSFHVVKDATRWDKIGQIQQALQVLLLVLVERPNVVISTGASPGYYAVLFGKFLGARTIWIDSIANAEKLSESGTRAGRYADLWLTQWPHLATARGPEFKGSVL